MEKERRIKSLSVVALIVAVLGLTVAFAALSQTLTINGSAKLDASKWGLKFDNLVLVSDDKYIEGTANIKTEDNTVIENMNVRLTTPGDKVVYKVDLVNEGTINAKIDKIVKTTTPDYLSFKVYKGNTGNDELNEGYVLGKETSIPLRIEIEFKKNITKEDLPTEARTIGLSYGVTFVQTDEEATSIGQGPSSACTTFEKKSAYNVGDEIALCNNDTGKSEDFYVISDNGDTVTALAKYNLLVGNSLTLDLETGDTVSTPIPITEEGYGLQSIKTHFEIDSETGMPSTNVIKGATAFAEDKNSGWGYWTDSNGKLLEKYGVENEHGEYDSPIYVFDENSLLYEPLKNYESYLKTSLGKTSINTSLLSYEQATSLGCDKANKTCKDAPSWVYSESYWLGFVTMRTESVTILCNGYYDDYYFFDVSAYGLRPVITISKTDL